MTDRNTRAGRDIREIRLPRYGIIIRIDCGGDSDAAGTLTSDLKLPSRTAAARLFNAAIDGLESLVLAHACAGINVASPVYIEGIESAVDAIANHHGP